MYQRGRPIISEGILWLRCYATRSKSALLLYDLPSTDSDHEDSPESESEEEDETSGNISDEEVRQYTKS